jgi:hypothetical protein
MRQVVRAVARNACSGVLLFCATLLPAVAPATAQTIAGSPPELDRSAFVGTLCGGAGAIPGAVQTVLAAVPRAAPADRDWAVAVASSFEARGLKCAGSAGIFLSRVSGTVNAITLAPAAVPDDARTPFPGLRSRGRWTSFSRA